jgi:hypothetical protein
MSLTKEQCIRFNREFQKEKSGEEIEESFADLALLNALDKSLFFNSPADRKILLKQLGRSHKKHEAIVYITRELRQLMLSLCQHGILKIACMNAHHPLPRGPHGYPDCLGKNIQFCTAIDIGQYNGQDVNLNYHHSRVPAYAIKVVTDLLWNFPEKGTFDVGFPRPIGGHHVDPKHDIFFPVTNLRQPQHSMPLSKMLQPAQLAVRLAMRGRDFRVLFPDGADHLHVKAY